MTIDPANWAAFQKLLLLCVIPEPSTFPYVLEQIIRRKNAGAGPLVPELEELANELIVRHSGLRHSSEVANAAWACLALRLALHDPAIDAISKCDDSVVALLAIDCERHGLTSKPIDKSVWGSHMMSDALYDSHWLLAYEANIKNWLPSVHGGDYVAKDVNFGFLKQNKVSFYNTRLASPPRIAKVPLPKLPSAPLTFTGYE
jgi:hypothetical protein